MIVDSFITLLLCLDYSSLLFLLGLTGLLLNKRNLLLMLLCLEFTFLASALNFFFVSNLLHFFFRFYLRYFYNSCCGG